MVDTDHSALHFVLEILSDDSRAQGHGDGHFSSADSRDQIGITIHLGTEEDCVLSSLCQAWLFTPETLQQAHFIQCKGLRVEAMHLCISLGLMGGGGRRDPDSGDISAVLQLRSKLLRCSADTVCYINMKLTSVWISKLLHLVGWYGKAK